MDKTNIVQTTGDSTTAVMSQKATTDALAQITQSAPEFVDSTEQCTDTSKLYVLPDGYIYAWMYKEGGSTYTNLANPNGGDWKKNSRINASGAVASSSETNAFVSNVVTCKNDDILRIKGVTESSGTTTTSAYFAMQALDSSGASIIGSAAIYLMNPNASGVGNSSLKVESIVNVTDDGVYEYHLLKVIDTSSGNTIYHNKASNLAQIRIGGIATDGAENVIITINEEIVESNGGYQWTNTGRAFVATDYEDRIVKLEADMDNAEKRLDYIEDELENKENATGSLVKWCAMGDSITQGYVSYLNGTSPTSKVDVNNAWASIVSDLNHWELTNKAIGGTGWIDLENSDTVGTTAAWNIAQNTDFTPYNLVTLAYGINDWKGNITLGTINDAIDTPTTIYGGMKATIEAIMSSNPHCKIIVLTPLNCAGYNFDYGTEATNWGLSKSFSKNGTLEDVFQAMVDVCEYYGIEYVDMTHQSAVNRKNLLDLLIDGVHPSAEAHKLLAYELAKKLNFV